jgi:hypothetical protein
MRRRWAGCLTLLLAGWADSAFAQTPTAPVVTLGAPVPVPPRPEGARDAAPVARGQMPEAAPAWTPISPEPPSSDDGLQFSIAPLQVPLPSGAGVFITTAASSSPLPPVYATPAYAPSADSPIIYPAAPAPSREQLPPSYFGDDSPSRDRDRKKSGRKSTSYFGQFFDGWGGNGPDGGCLESDHCFDEFASPVTNPFYFEDPRSLTEVRPIFFYQTIPNANSLFRGGNAEFFGLQARVALTENWSFVMNKLGGVWINPGDNSPYPSEGGFSELWLGPKWTFLRNSDTGTVVAAGVTFEIPTGPAKVFQDTGKLSVVPYITAAQNCFRTQYGSVNFMDTFGYSFRCDGERSDFLYNSFHVDYDVANLHKIYPLLELNWFHYTRAGGERFLDFEGRDFANIGSRFVNNRNNLSLAIGMRYKFSEAVQAGLATEFPLNGTRDMLGFRLGLDLIFRY